MPKEDRTLATLCRLGERLGVESSPVTVARMVTDAGVELTGAAFCALYTAGGAGADYRIRAVSGIELHAFERLASVDSNSFPASLLGRDHIIRCEDAGADAASSTSNGIRSFLAVPLVSDSDHIFGTLLFGDPEPGMLNERAELVARALASHAATAREKVKLRAALEHKIKGGSGCGQSFCACVQAGQPGAAPGSCISCIFDGSESTVEQPKKEQPLDDTFSQPAMAGKRNEESQGWATQNVKSLGHLSGAIAHDFNNLLAVVIGNAEVLSDAIDDPDLRELAGLIVTAAEKGAALTDRLLAFGRQQALRPEPVRIGMVVEYLHETVQQTIGEHITLSTETDVDRPAHVDRGLLESAVIDLVANACDAMPNGGTLTMRAEVVSVDSDSFEGFAPGDYICLSVADTGFGMSRDVLDHAFDPFFTTKNPGRGAGMGLSMVYGFAEQSGGHVTIESAVARGTTVRLYLPAAHTDGNQQDAKAPSSAADAVGGERILLVEDEPQLRRYVHSQLSKLGYDVLEAEAGPSALQILESDPKIDLLFTDLIMPGGMNGFDLVRRARSIAPHLKVLLTTGYAPQADELITDANLPILKKPYKKQQLVQTLRGVLEEAA